MDETTAPTPGATETVEEAPVDRVILSETLAGRGVLTIIEALEREEEYVRYRSVLKWRKHLHYWNGVQYLAESTTAHDWVTPEDIISKDPQADLDPALYAKVVNIYKAHGEIIIGALTSGTPTVRFFPVDADDHEDTMTAKAASNISALIQRQNKARLLLMKSLFILYNQGFVACYNEQKEDSRFGTVSVDEFESVDAFERDHYCPSCGFHFGSEQWQAGHAGDQGPVMSPMACPQCHATVQPEVDDTPTQVQNKVGTSERPKNREILEVYGPLNVKVPMWVREQGQTPYLDLETEESVYALRAIYPEIEDLIESVGYPESLERESRVPTLYRNDFPKGICTVQRVWLRPMAYTHYRRDDLERMELEKTYPNGCYAVIINRTVIAEILSDELDAHWTINQNPLSETLHAEPIGGSLIPLQDITNELANLTLETIEFGLPEIFADNTVLDFDAYQKQEARPGQITPATVKAGGTLSQGFHEVKPASLSREVELFADRVTTTSQFVMGTFPSIFGGAQDSRGGSAKEYEMAKASGLQRLSTLWVILQEWWASVMAKSVRSFIKHMQEDEKFVTAKGNNFLNVWIKQAEVGGNIGEVEPEVGETFPISWSQKRDVIMNLMQMQDPNVTAVITHPENAGLVANIIGVPEMYIPGDDDRSKQLSEIAEMLQAEPQEVPDPMLPGQTKVMSTVPIDQELDNHPVEAEICKSWLIGPIGQDAKKTNPAGYMNVLAHFKEHKAAEQQQQMAMQAPPPGSNPDDISSSIGGPQNVPQ